MIIVTNAAELKSAVSSLSTASVLAIDTEFMREKTYYPKLCLLQIACEDELFIIDPLPHNLDLRPLAKLWSDEKIVKVFHAGTQDLKILYDACGASPRPYFDTQDAATLIGQPEQIGYGSLVERLLGVKLANSDSFTDWAKRPLSKDQLAYAAEDVSYLLKLYPIVVAELESLGRESWLDEEFSRRSSSKTLTLDPQVQYRRLKRVASLKPHQLAIAREVAAWREHEAMRRDIPKRWLLSDEAVLEISRRAPTSIQALGNLRGITAQLKRSLGDILAAVEKGKNCPQDQWPKLPERPRLNGDDSAALELMAAIVRKRSSENRLSSSVLASRAVLEEYLANRNDDCALMQGWRKQIIGDELKQLLEGRLSLSLKDNCLVIKEDSCGS